MPSDLDLKFPALLLFSANQKCLRLSYSEKIGGMVNGTGGQTDRRMGVQHLMLPPREDRIITDKHLIRWNCQSHQVIDCDVCSAE